VTETIEERTTMARAHKVPSSRVVHRCGQGHDIPAGEGYYWAAPGFRASKKYRCLKHPFRPSELTTSLVGEVYAAQEAWSDAADGGLATIEDIQAAYEEFEQALTDYRDQRQEALDAWEYGNAQLEEYLEAAEDALGEIEGWHPEDESWSGDETLLEEDAEERATELDEDERADFLQEITDARADYEEWVAGVVGDADERISGISL
jgi:hypothetical protein